MPPRSRVSLVPALLLVACGGAVNTPEPSNGQSPPAPLAPHAWAEMDTAARRDYMVGAVLPRMEPLFSEYDGEHFADFSCATCHGSGARSRGYAMPNPALPTLYPTGSAEQQATVAAHERMATFMFQKVTPTMRELLGKPEYEPASGRGFSCFYCHPRGESAQL